MNQMPSGKPQAGHEGNSLFRPQACPQSPEPAHLCEWCSSHQAVGCVESSRLRLFFPLNLPVPPSISVQRCISMHLRSRSIDRLLLPTHLAPSSHCPFKGNAQGRSNENEGENKQATAIRSTHLVPSLHGHFKSTFLEVCS